MIKTFKNLVVYQKNVSLDRYSPPLAGGWIKGRGVDRLVPYPCVSPPASPPPRPSRRGRGGLTDCRTLGLAAAVCQLPTEL